MSKRTVTVTHNVNGTSLDVSVDSTSAHTNGKEAAFTTLLINDKIVGMKVDPGAKCNVLLSKTFELVTKQ